MKKEFQRKNPGAQILVEIGYVPYGYQLDIHILGKYVYSECKDWAGDYKTDVHGKIALAIAEAMQNVEKTHLKKKLVKS